MSALAKRFVKLADYRRLAKQKLVDQPRPSAFLPPEGQPAPNYVLGVLLVALRLPVGLLMVALAAVSYSLLSLGRQDNPDVPESTKPFGKLRRFGLRCASIFPRLVLGVLGYHRAILQTPEGFDRFAPENPILVVSNHQCFLETLFLLYYFQASFVAKSDARKIPAVGPVLSGTQTLWLDRNDVNSRTRVRQEIVRRAMADPSKGRYENLLIFPEGTVSNGKQVISFSSGAFNAGVPVLPVSISHGQPGAAREFFPGGHQNMNSAILRIMMNFSNHIQIKVFDPYTPSQAEKEDPRLYADNVRALIASGLNIPRTDHTHLDVLALINHLDIDKHGSTEFAGCSLNEFGDLLAVNSKHIKALAAVFKRAAGGKSPRLTRAQFLEDHARLIGCQDEMELELWACDQTVPAQCFDVIDVRERGYLVYQEFLLGFGALLRQAENVLETLADPQDVDHLLEHLSSDSSKYRGVAGCRSAIASLIASAPSKDIGSVGLVHPTFAAGFILSL